MRAFAKKAGEYCGILVVVVGAGWTVGKPAFDQAVSDAIAADQFVKVADFNSVQKKLETLEKKIGDVDNDVHELKRNAVRVETTVNNTEKNVQDVKDSLEWIIQTMVSNRNPAPLRTGDER